MFFPASNWSFALFLLISLSTLLPPQLPQSLYCASLLMEGRRRDRRRSSIPRMAGHGHGKER